MLNENDGSNDPYLIEMDDLHQSGIYPEASFTETAKFQDEIRATHDRWNQALSSFGSDFGIEGDRRSDPRQLESKTIAEITKRHETEGRTQKTIVGIAGPGATGKETIANALGYPQVLRTTTRQKRPNEIDGEHYNFLSEEEFEQKTKAGEFVSVTHRQDRGWYGILKKDLEKALTDADVAIIEENPETLTNLKNSIEREMPQYDGFVIVYLLPPAPVALHLALRLAKRCVESGDDLGKTIASTMGERQIAEFQSLKEPIKKGIDTVFIVNDKIDRATNLISDLVEDKNPDKEI